MVIGRMDLPLERIAEVCRKYRVRELSVFGSVLREDFRPDSDVDLLVDFLPNHGLGLIDYISCQEELSEVVGRPVDLVQKSGLKRFVKGEVLRTHRVIYAA
ncbi:MAG TPA: nucleotidyltransferase family protein [Phycisphaerae bacterium]|nr:nucleotidyltransferase family protein [Phycisphaerae bacterium]